MNPYTEDTEQHITLLELYEASLQYAIDAEDRGDEVAEELYQRELDTYWDLMEDGDRLKANQMCYERGYFDDDV